VTALACLALALAVLCAPAAPAAGRWGGIWPDPRRHRRSPTPLTRVAPALLGGIAGLVAVGPGGAVAGAAAVALVRRRRAQQLADAAAAAGAAELAEALRRLTDELRAGAHPADALDGVTGDGPRARAVLAPAAVAARLGDGVPGALERAAAAHPGEARDLVRVARAWALADRHGVPLADLLGNVGDELRWRVRFGAQVRALLAGPRATAGVLTALPALGLGFGALVGADPVGVLRDGLVGQSLLVLGTALTAVGVVWTERILHSAVPR